MKKNIFFMILLIISAAFISCDDESTDPVPDTGTIYIESEPSEAEIWIDGVNTGVLTPGTVETTPGSHVVTLKKEGYGDLDITVAVTAGEEFVLTSGTTLSQLGMLIIESEPAGATIWLDGVNTGDVTPNNYPLPEDNYTITLQLENYADTTVITQISNSGTVTVSINLRPEFITSYSTVIWETIGTTSEQPSGLDLSTGNASSIASGNNADVDIFYNSDGFIVMSANGRNQMTRETFFKIGDGKNLYDGINSSVKDGTWTTSIPDTVTKYVFLYDEDGHYSKFQILDIEGGTPGDPARLEVLWFYNENSDNVEF